MHDPLAFGSAPGVAGGVPPAMPRTGGPITVRLTVYGVPAPKGSRTLARRADGSVFTRPAANGEHRWMHAVAEVARWRAAQDVGPLPDAPYAVRLDFAMPRPKRPAHDHPTRGDIDKLARAVLDGLVQGGLLSDDRHVVVLEASKTWAAAPGGEGVMVTITHARTAEPASERANAPEDAA
jgi:Holliday junction resolvase RusA-like endonuclease